MENYLARNWLDFSSTSRISSWIIGLYVELGMCMLVMIALPVFLLYRQRHQTGDYVENLEHRLRTVPWHMQKEIDEELLKYRKEQLKLKRKKRQEGTGVSKESKQDTKQSKSDVKNSREK